MYSIIVIPGKNWKLSLAELIAFLEIKNHKFYVNYFSKEFFVIQLEKKINPSVINALGGAIKIGEIETSFRTAYLKEAILNKDKISKKKIRNIILEKTKIIDNLVSSEKKTFFGVSIYCSEKKLGKISTRIQRFFGKVIKEELAEQGKKSRFMGFSKNRKNPQLSHVEVIKKRLIDNNGELIISTNENQTWLSTTKAVHNPFEFQKRDIEKPIQRKIFAMPPRIARILINLALCDRKNILLDPFCGVGSILLEGALNGSKVIGIDINPWCIRASEKNLEWLINNYQIQEHDFRVMLGDVRNLSGKIRYKEIDCIVTEPDLGPALQQVPTNAYAQKIINKLDVIYSAFLIESYKILKKNGRCVFVSPYLRTRSGNFLKMNIEEKAGKAGFKRVFPFNKDFFRKSAIKTVKIWENKSLVDISKRHKTGREIHIFQK